MRPGVVATNLFALLVRLGWRFMQYTRDNSCNVVVFWRFEDKVGRLARGTMTPLLSLMGMVFIVSSKYFAKQSLLEKFAEGSWMQPFAFPWLSPRMNVELEELEFNNALWKPGVTKLVSEADVVLVLLTDPSENVLWEIEESLRHVPPRHMLIICAKSNRSLITKIIHEKMPSLTGTHDGRGLCFIQYGDHLLGRQLLKLRVCFRLHRLVRNRCEEKQEPVLTEETELKT